jgi:RecB family endonuclease NucS
MVATKLNMVQIQLLQLFARQMAENELAEVKAMLVAYYDRKITEEADKLWEQRGMSAETMNELLNTHIRSSYKPQ